MEPTMKDFEMEQFYDDEVAPKLQELFELCKDRGLPMICVCAYRRREDGIGFATHMVNPEETLIAEFYAMLGIIGHPAGIKAEGPDLEELFSRLVEKYKEDGE